MTRKFGSLTSGFKFGITDMANEGLCEEALQLLVISHIILGGDQ